MTIKRSPIILPNRKTLAVEPVNGKCLHIDTSSVAFLDIEKGKDDYITSISIEKEYVIKIGDIFEVNIGAITSQYEVKFMAIEKNDKSIVLFSSFPTRTTTFLLPLLNKTKTQLRYDTYFVNSYIDDQSESISLKYRFTGTELYKEFEQILMSDPLFITHRDYDPYHVIYNFRIPKEFHVDVEAFKEGKYSLFSKPLRQRILATEKPFAEQLDEAVGHNVENFYKELLIRADETIKAQRVQLDDLNNQQVEFRDEVAVACFVPLITEVGDYVTASAEAYRAADVFLRTREGGIDHVMVVNADVIEENK